MWHIEMVEGQRGFILVGGSMALKTIGSIASTVLGRKELTKGRTLTVVNAAVMQRSWLYLGLCKQSIGDNIGSTDEGVETDRGGVKTDRGSVEVRHNKNSGY